MNADTGRQTDRRGVPAAGRIYRFRWEASIGALIGEAGASPFFGTGTGLWQRVFRRERGICGHCRV